MAAVFATLDPVSAATKAVDHAQELGLPRPAQVAAIVANFGFVDAWEHTPEGARLDLLTPPSRRRPSAPLRRSWRC
jgi:hypothetical protein